MLASALLVALYRLVPSPKAPGGAAGANSVIYEANVRAFAPGGDLAAVTARLSAIRALGANVLWLMPIHPVGKLRSVGGLGSPYSVADYDRVNPEFGSGADLRQLVAEAHRRGMRVILDWVANHTAWDHPWIAAHPDWYTKDAQGAIAIPAGTNWNDVADLDYSKPALRKAMIAAMRGWIERDGVDGFRCDAADMVPADFWKEAIAGLRAASPRPLLMLAEGFRPENRAAGFDMEYGWPFYDRLAAIYKGERASSLATAAAREASSGGPHLRFVTNHDKSAWEGVPTDVFRSPEGVRGATVVSALYSGGAPLVYTGQEVAWPKRIPLFERSSVDWGRNRAEGAWLSALFLLRAAHPALRDGTTVDLSSEDVVAFARRKGGDEALVVANARGVARSLPLGVAFAGRWQDGFTKTSTTLAGRLDLPSDGYRVLFRAR